MWKSRCWDERFNAKVIFRRVPIFANRYGKIFFMKESIEISTDKNLLDIDFIHSFITESYWANGRSLSAMKICIDNSLNFGVYLQNTQVGYGRIVTDYVQFAYLMDLFIDSRHRGKGYALELVNYILNYPKLSNVKVWRLATSDAHGLYNKFGFTPLEKPENMMELKR